MKTPKGKGSFDPLRRYQEGEAEACDSLKRFCDGGQLIMAGLDTEKSTQDMINSLAFCLMSLGMLLRLIVECCECANQTGENGASGTR